MVAQIVNLLKGMCIGTQSWLEIICGEGEYIPWETENYSFWWHLIKSTRALKCSQSIMV